MKEKLNFVQPSYRKGKLKSAFAGNLKGIKPYDNGALCSPEIEYKVAKSAFDKYLRTLAIQKSTHTVSNISTSDKKILEKPLIHSRQLKVERNSNRHRIIHFLSGKTAEVSPDMIEFIDAFRHVTKPISLLKDYHISNILQIIQKLQRNYILIPATRDEELEYLNQNISVSLKERYETENFICLCSPKNRKPAKKLAQMSQNLYSTKLKEKFKPLRQKMIVYVADKRDELTQFWFNSFCPPWISCFVALRRVLVIDHNQIRYENWESLRFKAGMAHEIVHMLLSNHNICLPLWLEEGVCEYFSRPDPNRKLLNLIKKKELLTYKELETKAIHTLLDIDNSITDDNICYHQAHSFVRYLCSAIGEPAFIGWIDSIGINSETSEKFYEMFGKKLDEMEQAWFSQLISLID